MFPHHAQSVENLIAVLARDPTVVALLLGGSIAHGYARPDSDIDVAIVVTPEELQRRRRENRLHYNNRDLCAYDGYIDGKFMDLAFLQTVAERGSEPARYAFEGNRILFSRDAALERLLGEIVRYPTEHQPARLQSFAAQLLAWRWYYSEALRQQNRYLVLLSLQKVVLFSSRLVLAVNQRLYPYHKWLLRVLQSAPRRPPGMLEDIDLLLGAEPGWAKVDAYCRGVLAFAGFDFATVDAGWPTQFMQDTELKWVLQEPCVDDW